MNCPKCGKELIEREEGTLLCEGCGTQYRRKKKAENLPAEKTATAPVSPTSDSAMPATEEPTPAPPADRVEENAARLQENADIPAQKTEDQLRIELLERRLAEMEARQSEDKKKAAVPIGEKIKRFFAAIPDFAKSHKKAVALSVFALLGAILTIVLCVSLCGVRGVYVNTEDPNNYYVFTASSYTCVWENEFGDQEKEKGNWSTSGGKITFTIKDEDFGKLSEDFSFKKKGDNNTIVIDDKEYTRVARSMNKKVTVTFDANGGNEFEAQKIPIGNTLSELPTPTNPGNPFVCWMTESGNRFYGKDPFWTDMTLIAKYETCNHTRMTCEDEACKMCGKAYADMSQDEILALTHDLNDACVCTKCGIEAHNYDDNFTCSRCGTSLLTIVGSTLTKVRSNYIGALTIPDSVTSIGERAFYECTGLTSVTIGNGVTSIGERAFFGCTGLTSVTIGNGVTSIGERAFFWCPIETAIIPAIACSSIKNNALKTVVITSGESIGWYAFNGCTSLTSITIPDSVTSIGYDAFRGCTGLTSVTIPDSVTSIVNYAFQDCSGLTSVTIGNGVTSIGDYAFDGCYKLVEVYNKSTLSITNGSTNNGFVGYYAKAVYTEEYVSKLSTTEDGYILYTDGSLVSLVGYPRTATELTLPDGITEINQYAFSGCSSLTSVTIPDIVTSIGAWAFSGCSGLTSVTIGSGVTSIGVYAFWCSGLTSVTIGSGVTSIGEEAFRGCSSLTSVTIPDSVTSIGNYAFSGCDGLTSIHYTGDLAGWFGISGLYNLMVHGTSSTSLYINGAKIEGDFEIPNVVTSIGAWAFIRCTGLTSITIPDSVTSIESGAFSGCTGLTSITIPNSVASINYAFYKCSKLTSITFQGTKAQWNAIWKSDDWDNGTSDYTIHCTDGDISKS